MELQKNNEVRKISSKRPIPERYRKSTFPGFCPTLKFTIERLFFILRKKFPNRIEHLTEINISAIYSVDRVPFFRSRYLLSEAFLRDFLSTRVVSTLQMNKEKQPKIDSVIETFTTGKGKIGVCKSEKNSNEVLVLIQTSTGPLSKFFSTPFALIQFWRDELFSPEYQFNKSGLVIQHSQFVKKFWRRIGGLKEISNYALVDKEYLCLYQENPQKFEEEKLNDEKILSLMNENKRLFFDFSVLRKEYEAAQKEISKLEQDLENATHSNFNHRLKEIISRTNQILESSYVPKEDYTKLESIVEYLKNEVSKNKEKCQKFEKELTSLRHKLAENKEPFEEPSTTSCNDLPVVIDGMVITPLKSGKFSDSQTQTVNEGIYCINCKQRVRSILNLPCNHMLYCEFCHDLLRSTRKSKKAPSCDYCYKLIQRNIQVLYGSC